MERYERNQYSPAGQIDQWGDLAQGLKQNRSGRRRAVRMLVALAVVLIVGLGLVCLLALGGLLA
ncbi:hypothetical protein O2V63_18725 [Modestobacter sp. VKM Ac-2977]|uniref:hypothetical protein n=1 Tax=Modestobacter sp. VKM Ac-2977 TaxID=3004131 RepID=UPI0022AA7219|nr:hypothetical protein [Modestobacter sp. VKM Ac-2977]MCZ2822379.1 hypothetical protein [Modestobacter sp. VKM Ac-2977]